MTLLQLSDGRMAEYIDIFENNSGAITARRSGAFFRGFRL